MTSTCGNNSNHKCIYSTLDQNLTSEPITITIFCSKVQILENVMRINRTEYKSKMEHSAKLEPNLNNEYVNTASIQIAIPQLS